MFFDYSNIELRILAYYLATTLDDWQMVDEFKNHEDLHTNTAVGLYGISHAQVTEPARQDAKRFNFSVVYGGGVPTIIRQGLARDSKEAKKLLEKFHATRPGIKLLVDRLIRRLDDVGYLQTPWGSRLHPIDDHKALNVLIQGCAADLIRHAIRECSRWLREQELQSHIVNVVHDELMFDVARGELLRMTFNVPACMQYDTLNEVVPIEAGIDISWTNWAEKEKYHGRA